MWESACCNTHYTCIVLKSGGGGGGEVATLLCGESMQGRCMDGGCVVCIHYTIYCTSYVIHQ